MSKFTDILNSPLPSHTDSAEAMLAAIESELGIESGEEYMEDFDDIDLASGSEPLSAEENSDYDDCIQDDEGDPSEDGSATEGSDTSVADDVEDISDDGDDDLNPDDLDDDELRKLDAELSGGSSNSDDEEKLTPEEEIQADDMVLEGETFSRELGLASSNFSIKRSKNNICFLCKGKGHGLGFSQYGGDQLAKNKKTAEEILTTYFADMQIVNVREIK